MSHFPDLVIKNAVVITMDPDRPMAQAVAARDGLITALGSSSEIEATAGPDTQVVDLGGATLMPGFVEAHGHALLMAQILSTATVDIRLASAPTWDDVRAKIEEAVASTATGQPVVLYGFDPIGHQMEALTADELDEFTSEHPLLLLNFTAHSASANHYLMEMVGLTRETADPPGAKFSRHDDGTPDGRVIEAAAVAYVAIPLLGLTGFDPVKECRAQYAVLARAGITTLGELLTQAHERPFLSQLGQLPGVPIRVRHYEATNDSLQTSGAAGETDPMARQVGLKVWLDGTPFLGNISLKEPYLDTQATRNMGLPTVCCGSANYTRDQMLEILRAYAPSGLQMACHVQGDAGVDTILDAYEIVLAERGLIGTDHRWRLEHCGAMTAEQFRRAHALGVTCSLFIHHFYFWAETLSDDLLGQERGENWMRLRSALDSGMKISLHNDGYLTPPDPIGNVWSAMNRITFKSRKVLGPDQRITLDEALRAVTIDAAWQLFSDHEVGSIEVGKFADFAELSADPYSVDSARFNEEVCVTGTWLAGHRTDPDSFAAAGT